MSGQTVIPWPFGVPRPRRGARPPPVLPPPAPPAPAPASAQPAPGTTDSTPGWATGYVPPADEWNGLWAGKTDVFNGELNNPTVTGGTADNLTIGSKTPAAGYFTNASFGGALTVTGAAMVRASTVAALRALAPPTGPCLVILDGYTNAGDRGGGSLDWDQGATIAKTGNTHGTTTIDGLSPTTTLLWPGMGVSGSGIPANATIATVVSLSSITLNVAATTSASAVALTFTLADDGVITFTPTALTTQQPGRWLRRLEANEITLEMAGGRGDYVFPNTGVGEVLGTDNTTAFVRIQNIAGGAAFSVDAQAAGMTIKLGPGNYRVAGAAQIRTGQKVEGVGLALQLPLGAGNLGELGFTDGSMLAVDPATGSITLQGGSQLSNVRVTRRGLDMNPTTAQVKALWSSLLQELTANNHWVALTAYTAGQISMNLGRVYWCDTPGTSGADNTNGPIAETKAVNSITDGTVGWHFLNQFSWTWSTVFVAGTICCNVNNIYLCDTGGTSSAAVNGPTGTTTAPNSITDGTVKWHYIGTFSTGVISSTPYNVLNDMTVVGFAKGVLLTKGATALRNIFMDNLNCLDFADMGDMAQVSRVHCAPYYMPTADTPPDASWRWKRGICFFIHDNAQETFLDNCEAESWNVGVRLSNVWGTILDKFAIEGPGNYTGEAGIQLRNVCCYVEIAGCYVDAGIGYDIGATRQADASTPNIITQSVSTILLHGGQLGGDGGFLGPGGPTAVQGIRISGNAAGSIYDLNINVQSATPFTFTPPDAGGSPFWNIKDIRLDASVGSFAGFANVDPSMAPYVHFSDCWSAGANAWIVQPGRDDSIDLVAAPVSAGTHTISNNTSWCHLTPSGPLATYTLTLPAVPMDTQQVTVSSTQTLSTLTLSPNSGQSVSGAATTLLANSSVVYRYNAASTTWMRMTAPPGLTRLFTATTTVGNGADTTVDTLQTYTLPAASLVNVGDTVKVLAAGTFIGSTDSKSVVLDFGGSNIGALNTTAATNTVWRIEATVTKTGSNAQRVESLCYMSGGSGTFTSANSTLGKTDTTALVILVTGQDNTTATANAIVCTLMSVDIVHV